MMSPPAVVARALWGLLPADADEDHAEQRDSAGDHEAGGGPAA